MKKNSYSLKLLLEFTEIALRYERKLGAIELSAMFLLAAELESMENVALRKIIDKSEEYLKPYSLDFHHHFAGLLLFNVISEVEMYFVEILKALIKRYPKKVGDVSFRLSQIVDIPKEELIASAAEDYLNRLMYKKPNEYLGDLASTLSIEKALLEEIWPPFVEAKARRDLGIHNNWQVNDIYQRKIAQVGLPVLENKDEFLCPDYNYLVTIISVCDQIIRLINKQLLGKYV